VIPQLSPSPATRQAAAPLVLIADEDPQTLELLSVVFNAEHFRVITAIDGDEAIRRALAERPDLVVLEVRLPKRNGFEVCDYLRHDPEDPQVPLLFVASTADAEVRIEGLARGADDFLSKPFAPRELVARSRRLLARAADLRAQRRRAATLEHDLGRSQEETRRANRELTRERRMREMAYGVGRELQITLDVDELAERTLAQAMRQLGSSSVVLLAPGDAESSSTPALVVRSYRGAGATRFADIALSPTGELATVLAGLGRPVLAHELERWPGLRAELATFASAGAALLAPLRGPMGLEGVLVADERLDGQAWSAEDRDVVRALCDLSATAHLNARRYRESQDRALEQAAARAHEHPRAALAAAEAGRMAEVAAAALELPARERGLVRHAVAFGPWAWGEEGREALRVLDGRDSSRRVEAMRALMARGESLDIEGLRTTEERHAALLIGVCVRYQVGRRSGRSMGESWNTAVTWAGAADDPAMNDALAAALRALSGNRDEHRAA
jgi:DNA-binding response OmpR family regulator